MDLSSEQFDIYYSIKQYYIEHGISPTIRDLCNMTGKKSTATILYHLRRLKKKGYIDFLEKKSRTIRVIK